MNLNLLCATIAFAALGIAGCSSNSTDTYKGEAVESGKIIIAVTGTDQKATNEAPPRKVENQDVTVTKTGSQYTAKFGNCSLTGESSTSNMAVVKGSCDVKVANWEGKLPLSATLSFSDGGLKMEALGNAKNDNAVVSYEWTFTGKK